MFVCIVSFSQPSSGEWYLLYVKCLCVLSRYLSHVVENGICYMLNVLCVLSRYLGPVVVENFVSVICWYLLKMFVCIVSLSQPSSREWYLLYVKCLCVLSRYLGPVAENDICYMLHVCVY